MKNLNVPLPRSHQQELIKLCAGIGMIKTGFRCRYRHRQAPVNDKHLKNLRATRALITEGINDAVDARGGGSTSGMLRAFGGAETEWILRQLYSSSAPSISKTQFTSKLRSNIFYQDSTDDPEAQRSFERAIDKFRQAEATMSDAQQATFRREILAYFDYNLAFALQSQTLVRK